MMNKLDVVEKLEQDNFEGVDEDEWVSFIFRMIREINTQFISSALSNFE